MNLAGAVVLSLLLTACDGGTAASPPGSALDVDTPTATQAPTHVPSSSEPAETPHLDSIATGSMVVTLVNDLAVRSEPNLDGSRLGTLPADEVAFVADGPVSADGHTWYQLASDTPCSEPNATRFHCQWWMGWVAGTAEDGTLWLALSTEACPLGPLDVSTFQGMTALHRLSCFGDATWTLRAYMAPVGGDRGGTSIFSTQPGWLDAWGSVIFPQLEERTEDASSALAMYAHPDLGCQFGGRNPGCAFAAFLGQWIDIRGHLDDPAAATCVSVYNPLWVDTLEDPRPPLPDGAETVLRCRSVFVATDVQAAR